MELSLVYFLCVLSLASASFNFGFSSSPVLLPRAKNPTSKDGNCGSNSEANATCLTSTFGNCCSEKGFCGKTSAYCSEGCQSAFGSCSSSDDGQLVTRMETAALRRDIVARMQPIVVLGDHVVNPDGVADLSFFNAVLDLADIGLNRCQSMFGSCSSSDESSTTTATSDKTSTSTSAASTSLGAISVDGNCGSNSDTNATCLDSEFGDCCSAKGYCGKTSGM
ncbi:Lectin-B [Fusarium pseudocircinatum]|uniref:Lectin-B n=1 Tax=Fusarium pseudocircinatum TaxID=56676 RepID=A0A8H5NS71_9HYPO|nr:Lectin-B [Fusarium pseudocircinatum]